MPTKAGRFDLLVDRHALKLATVVSFIRPNASYEAGKLPIASLTNQKARINKTLPSYMINGHHLTEQLAVVGGQMDAAAAIYIFIY